ncbi:MAG: thiosulfate sulfurtransferase [Rhodospirillales bacterium]|nr:thiosulfate sulfurtransferase [Rhodospirillales bacterium]
MTEPFEIDSLTLKERLDGENPPAVLDVREPWELEIASIEGALSIPLGELTGRATELPRDRPLAVMCHHGGRSAQATAWLRNQGFDRATNVAGGIDAWARTIDPTLSRY